MSMSYENDFQMHFVQLGLDEGLRRGEARALCRIAKRMDRLGISHHAIAACLDVEEPLVVDLLEGLGPYRGICDDFTDLEFTKARSDAIL